MRRWLISLAVLAVAPLAWAQGTAGSVELTPTVGYWFGDTLARGTTGAFDFDVTIDDSPSYGLRLAYRFTPNWALETFLAHERADLVTGHKELFSGQSRIGTIDLTTAEIGVEGSFGHSRLVPFLGAAIGGMRLDPNLSGLSADNRFAASAGGGLKLFLSPQLAVRFDFRGHSVNVGNRQHDCHWWDECASNHDWITFREVSLGLTFVI
jgi:Outer membrane protein beta-barrel domain